MTIDGLFSLGKWGTESIEAIQAKKTACEVCPCGEEMDHSPHIIYTNNNLLKCMYLYL